MDRIAIIGTGNVAWHITRLLLAHQYEVEVLGRKTRENSGFTFANSGFRYINSITSLSQDAILYLICTGDDQIVNAAKALPLQLSDKQVLAHTSGTTPSDILKPFATHYGVLWPLMTLKKHHIIPNQSIPFVVTGSDLLAEKYILKLASSIAHQVSVMDDISRKKMHMSAVIANNFTNHLLEQVRDYCLANQLDFTLLLPLLETTINNFKTNPNGNFQTGPAVRKDFHTIEAHLKLLESQPELKTLYQHITQNIIAKQDIK
ncbi:MAG: DUF2520 domain-containing protein [Saprospiraceae bacterium]|nr:MAG: oxidoreductase [Bacteroidetes bacterium OLB9]MCO6463649.1 DUF2520 domain-containing protein [Saprospiraceae bacterium]